MTRLRDLLVDGLFLALPLVAVGLLLLKVVSVLSRLLAPVARLLPEGRWLGVAALELLAVLVLLLVLLVLGMFARSRLGRRLIRTLEDSVLSKIPGYMMMKTVAAEITSSEQETGMRPALVSFDDNTVLGLVMEESPRAEMFTVFLPGSPNGSSGSVVLMPRSRVELLETPVVKAMGAMRRRGKGLQQLSDRAGSAGSASRGRTPTTGEGA